jgi:hypothetical protein
MVDWVLIGICTAVFIVTMTLTAWAILRKSSQPLGTHHRHCWCKKDGAHQGHEFGVVASRAWPETNHIEALSNMSDHMEIAFPDKK